MTKRQITFRHTQARVLIVTQNREAFEATTLLAVAAIVVWFLRSIPAQVVGLMVFQAVTAFRLWLRGWRDDLGLIWLALCMTARLEFA